MAEVAEVDQVAELEYVDSTPLFEHNLAIFTKSSNPQIPKSTNLHIIKSPDQTPITIPPNRQIIEKCLDLIGLSGNVSNSLGCFELAIISYAERSHIFCGAPRARVKDILRWVFTSGLTLRLGEGVVPSRPLS